MSNIDERIEKMAREFEELPARQQLLRLLFAIIEITERLEALEEKMHQ